MDRQVANKLDKLFDLVKQVPVTKLKPLERSKYLVSDLKIGSVVQLGGDTFIVTDKYKYLKPKKDEVRGQEYQLTSILTGMVRYLEYSEDDVVELYITIKELSTRDIFESIPHANYGFVSEGLGDFTLPSSGMDYYYDDKWDSRFIRENVDKSEIVRMVEFESDDEETYLTFEYWEDGSIEAFISKEIISYEIEIVSL